MTARHEPDATGETLAVEDTAKIPDEVNAERVGAQDAGAGDDGDVGDDDVDDDGESEEEIPIAVRLVRLVDPNSILADDRGDGYAHLRRGDHRELLRLRGRPFRSHLAELLYETAGKIPGREAISSAVGVLEAKARHRPRATLWNRVARGPDGAIWLDLADSRWRAVRIDRSGWRVVDAPPPLFRRFAHQAPLPEPARGGDLRRLFDFLNVASEADAILLLCSTVAALIPDVPQAVLILHGPQGSAKTTAARLRRSLIDPSAAPTVIVRRDLGELAQALDHHYMPLLDNLHALPAWMSDFLCQAATGGGFVKRELYSDGDDVLLAFRRPIILTGINVPATAPDLLDRSVLIRLERIPPDKRREELAVYREFAAAQPAIVGGLLDTLVGAMQAYPSIKAERLPRLADFARWGAAAAQTLGYGAPAFFAAMDDNVTRQIEEVVESDPLAQAVISFVSKRKQWVGSPTELLPELNGARTSKSIDSSWPRSPAELGRRLNVLAPVLTELGVLAESGWQGRGAAKRRIWSLSWSR